MSRRFFSITLALCVILTLAAPAFAADEPEPTPAPEYRLASITAASESYFTGQILFTYDNGGWLPTRIEPDDGLFVKEITYDEAGRVSSVITDSEEEKICTYDEAGNLLEEHTTTYDGDTVIGEEAYTYTYNENGDELSYSYNDLTPGLDDQYSYTIRYAYDESGALVGEDWDFPGMYTSHITYTNNEHGDEITTQTVQTSEDGTEINVTSQYEYTYDEAGNMTSETSIRDGETIGTTTYAYDEQGRQTSQVSENYETHAFYQPLLGAEWTRTVSYTMDESGQVVPDGANAYFSVRLYDEADNLICDWAVNAPEVPTPKYDENGYLVRVSCGEGELLEFTYEPVA